METEVQHTLRNVEIRFTVHLIFTSFRHTPEFLPRQTRNSYRYNIRMQLSGTLSAMLLA